MLCLFGHQTPMEGTMPFMKVGRGVSPSRAAPRGRVALPRNTQILGCVFRFGIVSVRRDEVKLRVSLAGGEGRW